MTVYQAKAKFKQEQPKFKVFYQDGSTYTDKSGPLERMPKTGVVCILNEDGDSGQRLDEGFNYYCYTAKGFMGTDYTGLIRYLSETGVKLVLVGGTVNPDVIEKAHADNYLKQEK